MYYVGGRPCRACMLHASWKRFFLLVKFSHDLAQQSTSHALSFPRVSAQTLKLLHVPCGQRKLFRAVENHSAHVPEEGGSGESNERQGGLRYLSFPFDPHYQTPALADDWTKSRALPRCGPWPGKQHLPRQPTKIRNFLVSYVRRLSVQAHHEPHITRCAETTSAGPPQIHE